MAADPTLDLDLTAVLDESRKMAAADQARPAASWDVIVVGSGAAGGMAAFQLATAGIKVLMLEAGRMLDTRKEYRTMEWPYAVHAAAPPAPRRARHQRRRIQLRRPPVRRQPDVREVQEARDVYAGNTFTRNWVVNEKENPTTGTPYAWVRARDAGRQDELLGARRAALRAAPVRGGQPRRLRRRLADPLRRREAGTTTRSTSCSAARARTRAWTQVPDGIFQRPTKLNCVEVQFKRAIEKMGRHLDPRPRRRDHRGRPQQQVPRTLHGPRALRPRLRHPRRVPLADRARLSRRATPAT